MRLGFTCCNSETTWVGERVRAKRKSHFWGKRECRQYKARPSWRSKSTRESAHMISLRVQSVQLETQPLTDVCFHSIHFLGGLLHLPFTIIWEKVSRGLYWCVPRHLTLYSHDNTTWFWPRKKGKRLLKWKRKNQKLSVDYSVLMERKSANLDSDSCQLSNLKNFIAKKRQVKVKKCIWNSVWHILFEYGIKETWQLS